MKVKTRAFPCYHNCTKRMPNGHCSRKISRHMVESPNAGECPLLLREARKEAALALWAEFDIVPWDTATGRMKEPWHTFPEGICRKEIIQWFEEAFPVEFTGGGISPLV